MNVTLLQEYRKSILKLRRSMARHMDVQHKKKYFLYWIVVIASRRKRMPYMIMGAERGEHCDSYILKKCIKNICDSYKRKKRKMHIISIAPFEHECIEKTGVFRLTNQFTMDMRQRVVNVFESYCMLDKKLEG